MNNGLNKAKVEAILSGEPDKILQYLVESAVRIESIQTLLQDHIDNCQDEIQARVDSHQEECQEKATLSKKERVKLLLQTIGLSIPVVAIILSVLFHYT